jgi:UDP-N-acetylglucosamine 2-epimerase (non-hydrolysing)
MQNIILVVATRPDIIKLAPVIRELRRDPERFNVRVIFTAQHRDLAAPLLDYFAIAPDHDLQVMTANQSPAAVTARVLEAVGDVLARVEADWVVVQGDTTSAMAAAMAAFYAKIPVAHVEAGLRTDTIGNPFPEEMNRRVITQLASLHLAATGANREALLRENVPAGRIHVTGNPVIDALGMILDDAHAAPPAIASEIEARGNRMAILTTHRRENFGEPQRGIFNAVATIVERHPSLEIVFPVHPNPAVAEAIARHLPPHPRVHLIAPLDYPPFVGLLSRAHLILSDSGGLQEEAPALGVPLLILRTTTERGEALDAGSAQLVGVDADAIVAAADALLTDDALHAAMAVRRFPFGEGNAARRIADALRGA